MNKFYSLNENSTDVWLTPPELIKSLGEFDIDPCSPMNRPWDTAKNHYTIEDDGLKQNWSGMRTWLNPPHSCWVNFIKKLSEHGNGICLIFARTETKGFFDYVWDKADAILFIKRRVKFLRLDGTSGSSTAPSVLIAYGENNVLALQNSKIEGKLIILK